MKIVALDTATDGVSFEAFHELGEFTEYDRSSGQEIVDRSRGADAILVNKVQINSEVLSQLPSLKYIGVTATGFNNVDAVCCKGRGIAVTNVVGYSTDSVAQLVLAFILHHYVRVSEYSALVARGDWVRSPDFCVVTIPQREIASLTIGIVGLGAIGRRVEELSRAFGMTVIRGAIPGRTYSDDRIPLQDLFSRVDVLTLHCALSKDTQLLIDAEKLSWLKPESVLINVSRGGLVNEPDLANALRTGGLSAYYADVLSSEPPPASNPLLSAPRAALTPHIAWATPEARTRLVWETFLNLKAFIAGEKRNRIV